ncbi:acyltransferase family protein [Salinispora fenicalii]|uniref:acyltransferase family protein n=1 Tax=Salinispora fenicalii TaxID=1137263 RepID=UPI00048A3148|nr:acyltransferase [Salinispora fenicalii]
MSTTVPPSPPHPSITGRLPALDALRAIGSVAVVAHHVGFTTGVSMNSQWGTWLARMDVGVAVFFVLSGFLLFRPWALSAATGLPRPGVRRYFWRRALRILPAYWLTVLVCLIVLPQNRPASAGDWLRHLTFTQIYQRDQLRAGLGQTWSLATEVMFYLVLPLVAVFAVGRTWRPVRTLAIAAGGVLVTAGWLILMGLGVINTAVHTMWLPSYAAWFCGGIVLAVAHVALQTRTGPAVLRVLDDLAAAPVACWAAAAGLLAIATTPIAGPLDLAEPTAAEFAVKLTLYLAVASLIMIPVAFGEQKTGVHKAFGSTSARWLGLVSYGLFLWHPLVIEMIYLAADRPLFTGGLLETFALTMAGGLAFATASYYGIERPIQALGARRHPRPATAQPESRAPTVNPPH